MPPRNLGIQKDGLSNQIVEWFLRCRTKVSSRPATGPKFDAAIPARCTTDKSSSVHWTTRQSSVRLFRTESRYLILFFSLEPNKITWMRISSTRSRFFCDHLVSWFSLRKRGRWFSSTSTRCSTRSSSTARLRIGRPYIVPEWTKRKRCPSPSI